MGNSIFEFGEKLGVDSPFGNWQKEIEDKREEKRKGKLERLELVKIEGPFNDEGEGVKYVSRKHSYYYLATLNEEPNANNIKDVKWAVSYDDKKADKSFYLFSGGRIENRKVKVNIQISNGVDKFTIYAYKGSLPNDSISVVAKFKQAIVLFIGGAGDKTPYLGSGPTNIVLNQLKTPFDNNIAPSKDYKSKYLGYEEAYKGKITTEVIPFIPNKDGTSINIIGHSLGGWNGGHLSKILSDKGYKVDLLVTVDPVGDDPLINAFSDIYWHKPNPKSNYWINIYANSEDIEMDDIIANLGVQWVPPVDSVNIFHEVNFHHRQAGKMFKEIIKEGISSSDFLLHFINLHLDTK